MTPESVWDYPRPPRVEPCLRRVRIVHAGATVADTTAAQRVLETSHPPGIYVPPEAVLATLVGSPTTSWCEFKGRAVYWNLVVGGTTVVDAAWSYPEPSPGFEAIAGHLSFYPGRVDEAWLDDERVRPQEGSFYGGWITDDVEGPFKGAPGTLGW
jgi:uncharacterized protein (DUF427 family)